MKRPGGVWLVTIYAALNLLIGTVGIYMLLSGKLPAMSGKQANLLESLGPLDYVVSVLFHICIALGGIYLFLLRKLALPLFIAAAGFNLAQTIWHIFTHRFMAAVGGQSPLAWTEFVVAWAIILAAILYVARLSRKGALR